MMDLATAVEVAGDGLVALRGVTQATRLERVGSLWLFRVQDPKVVPRDFVLLVHDVTPDQVIASARGAGLEGSLSIHHFLRPGVGETELIQAYSNLGLTMTSRYHLMARELRTVPEPPAIWTVWRATKFEQLQRISSAAKQIMSLKKDLLTSGLGVRVYAVEHDGLVIAWGRFVLQSGVAWVDDLFTQPSLRGRGVMTALLNFAERDVMESGVLETVLVCSETNREFHVRRGYETVAIKLRFLPKPGLLEGWMRTAKTHLGRLMRRA